MSFLKKLFGGGGGAREPQTEEYEGFRITPTPVADGNAFRLSARVEKEVDGETLVHNLVRADTVQGLEVAETESLRKAKQVIDEQGERIFR